MKYYEMPVIAGTTEQQIEQIKNYLYLQNEALNYNLEQGTAEKVFEQAQQVLRSVASPIESEQVKNSYRAFRDLIIGTAEEAFSAGDSFQRVLRQMEGYKSAFGTFQEEITREIGIAPSGTTDLYSYIGSVQTALESYKLQQRNFIKSGYLDTTANPPVFGIEIGMLESSYTEELDGQSTTIQATPEKIRITPGRISFITGSGNSETEAAYISNGAVYFPAAHITGGSISIGSGAFSVTSGGVLSATGATIGGTITAGSGSTFGGWTIGSNAIYRGSEAFYNANTLYFGSDGLSIKDKFKVDSNGYLTASGATLNGGTIKIGQADYQNKYPFEVSAAGALRCTSAEIGGWTVDASGLSRLYGSLEALIGAAGVSFGTYDGVNATTNYSGIDTSGILRARGAVISGTITAGAGVIGGWDIGTEADRRLKKLNNGVGIQLIPGSNPEILITEQNATITGNTFFQRISAIYSALSNASFKTKTINGKWKTYIGPLGLVCSDSESQSSFETVVSQLGIYSKRIDAVNMSANTFDCSGFEDSGNNYIKLGGFLIQWGKVNASLSSGAASGYESFSPAFDSTPAIAHSFNGSEPNKYLVKCNPGTNKFDWAVVPNGGTWTGTVGFTWIAIGLAS